jgi:hypothetical protein
MRSNTYPGNVKRHLLEPSQRQESGTATLILSRIFHGEDKRIPP